MPHLLVRTGAASGRVTLHWSDLGPGRPAVALTPIDTPAPTPSTPASGALWRLEVWTPAPLRQTGRGRAAGLRGLAHAFVELEALDVVGVVDLDDPPAEALARSLGLEPIRPLGAGRWLVGCAVSDWLRRAG